MDTVRIDLDLSAFQFHQERERKGGLRLLATSFERFGEFPGVGSVWSIDFHTNDKQAFLCKAECIGKESLPSGEKAMIMFFNLTSVQQIE